MLYDHDEYGYGYGYGGAIGPRGIARGWGAPASAVRGQVYGMAYGSTINCGDWCTQYYQQARQQICALDSTSPLCTTYTCAQLQQAIQGDCTLFVWSSATDLGSQIGFCARCVNGTWSSGCPQPAGTTCSGGGTGCTSDAQCPTGCTCVSGTCQCPQPSGGSDLLLIAAVVGAVAVAALFALEGPSKKTITIARPS
jgi:hypothetical protein